MFLFQFIPAPYPITEAGMGMLGALIGLIWMITTVDYTWPTFAAILAYSFHAFDLYPDSAVASSGIEDGTMRSMGSSVCMLMISLLLISIVLEKTGVLRRMMLWFVTRKFVKKGPWAFTFMFFLVSYIVSMFMDPTPATVSILLCAHALFKVLGFKKGDDWPMMIVAMSIYAVSFGFAATPIGHNLALFVLGLVAGQTGEPANMMSYIIIGVPVMLVVLLVTFFYFKFIVKTDTEHFEKVDYDVVEQIRPGKMDGFEKFTTVFCIIILVLWLLPGFLNIIVPDAAVSVVLNNMTALWPVMAAVVIFSVVHIDGRPILDLSEDLKRIEWTPIFLFAGILLIALSLGEQSTGIPQWTEMYIMPMFDNFSPFVTVLIIGAVCVILTNIINNWVVASLFTSLAVSLAASLEISPATIAVLIGLTVNCAYTSPAALATIAFGVSDEYCNAKYILKHGIVVCLISAAIVPVMVYFMGNIICP